MKVARSKVKLGRPTLKLLKRLRRVEVKATASAADAAGNRATSSRRITLRADRR